MLYAVPLLLHCPSPVRCSQNGISSSILPARLLDVRQLIRQQLQGRGGRSMCSRRVPGHSQRTGGLAMSGRDCMGGAARDSGVASAGITWGGKAKDGAPADHHPVEAASYALFPAVARRFHHSGGRPWASTGVGYAAAASKCPTARNLAGREWPCVDRVSYGCG